MQKSFVEKTVSSFTPNEFRKLIRSGEFRSSTSGYCEGMMKRISLENNSGHHDGFEYNESLVYIRIFTNILY